MGREDRPSPRRPAPADWLTAVGHPLRIEILHHLLTAGTATPSEIAKAQRLALGTASYHISCLRRHGIVRLAGRTQRRGAAVHHYQLTDRKRVVSMLWGIRAALVVTDIERDHGRCDTTVTLDPEALARMQLLTDDYVARLGELGLQTRERVGTDIAEGAAPPARELTRVAVLLATDARASAGGTGDEIAA